MMVAHILVTGKRVLAYVEKLKQKIVSLHNLCDTVQCAIVVRIHLPSSATAFVRVYTIGIKINYTFGHETVGVLNDTQTLSEIELKIKRPLLGCFVATRLNYDVQPNNNTCYIEIKCVC